MQVPPWSTGEATAVASKLVLRDSSGGEDGVAADAPFVMIGARPHSDWPPPDIARDEHGFVLTGADLTGRGWPLERRPLSLETSMPGVLAVGDVRHASVKRVASAVGEGAMAVQFVHTLFAEWDWFGEALRTE